MITIGQEIYWLMGFRNPRKAAGAPELEGGLVSAMDTPCCIRALDVPATSSDPEQVHMDTDSDITLK